MLGSMGMSGPKRARKPKRARSGNCVHFDGTNDSVSFSDYDISASGTGDFSISLWFKTDSTTDITSTALVNKEQSRSVYWQLYINGVDKAVFVAKNPHFLRLTLYSTRV